jgi:large subunit ribosomal protein L5
MNRLQLWHEHILKKDCVYKEQILCVYKIPTLKNIVLNLNNNETKYILSSITAIELITNQKPVFYTAKKSIAAFKLRQGSLIGCKVSLRKKYMFDFLELLIFLVLPKIPNFGGFYNSNLVNNSILSIGLSDLTFFIQISKHSERFQKQCGCTITFITNTTGYNKQNFILNSFQLPQKKLI